MSSTGPTLPPELASRVEEELGPVLGSAPLPRVGVGGTTWRVSTRGGVTLLKRCRSRRAFEDERRALSSWGPHLGGRAPNLLAAWAEPTPALLIQLLSGRTADRWSFSAELERDLWRQAGGLLARLHHLSSFEDDDPLPLSDALSARAGATLDRCAELLPSSSRARVVERLSDFSDFAELRRVPCHRDYQPGNWLVRVDDARIELSLIDFEWARPDAWLVDLVRLHSHAWRDRPERREAFLEGYGRELDDADLLRLEKLAWLDLVGTLAWAVEHEDAELEQTTRARLDMELARG
ncbi:MAG: phosphotransferase [Acidobacteriota bacterium]